MRKLFIGIAIAGFVWTATGCGDDDSDGSSSTDAAIQDSGGQSDAGRDADDGLDVADVADVVADGAADGGMDAADGHGDGDTGADVEAVSLETYQAELTDLYMDAFCTGVWECSPVVSNSALGRFFGRRFDSEASCRSKLKNSAIAQQFGLQEVGRYKRLIDAGRVKFDGEQAAKCLNSQEELSTDQVCKQSFLDLAACDRSKIFSGTLAAGDACLSSRECDGEDLFCGSADGSAECESTCQVRSGCGDGPPCGPDEYCSDDSNTCEPGKSEGDECSRDQQCLGELRCMTPGSASTGTCLGPQSRQRQQSCDSNYFCQHGDRCFEGLCTEYEFTAEGEPCTEASGCMFSGDCSLNDACVPGATCVTHQVDGHLEDTCESLRAVGESCSNTQKCEFGLYCKFEPSMSDDSVGTTACANAKANGTSCEKDAECASRACTSGTCGGLPEQCPIP